MSDLPDGWVATTLGALCEAPQYGWTTSAQKSGFGSLRLVRTTDISGGHLDWENVPYCSQEPPSPDRYMLESGDIVISRAGSVGFSHRLTKVEPSVFASYLIRFRPLKQFDGRYIAWFLQSPDYWRQVRDATSGITLANINAKKLSAMRLPVPSRAEQERIVAAIEAQLSRLDAGLAALKRALTRLDVLRDQSIFALVSTSGAPRRLGDVAEINLGRQRSPKNHTGSRMRPYLRAANVTWKGLDLGDVKSMNFTESESSTYELRRGDILVAEASGSASEVGKPAIWAEDVPGCCFQNTLLRVRSTQFVPDYLYFVLLAHARHGTFARTSKGVGIHHLSKAGLSALVVDIPGKAEQEQVAERIHIQQASIGQLAADIERQASRALALRSAIHAAAFNGSLVPQDTNDEPASILLRRIASERTATSSGQSAGTRVAHRKVTA